MQKFFVACLLKEVYNEILVKAYKKNEEKIMPKDVDGFFDADIIAIGKSKFMVDFIDNYQRLPYSFLDYLVPNDFITIMIEKVFTKDKIKELVKIINPYIDYYQEVYKKFYDKVHEVLDLKYRMKGYIGNFPMYLKLDKDMAFFERLVLDSSMYGVLNYGEKFGMRITYLEYQVPLKDYQYNKFDLRDKSIDEIFRFMDQSASVNIKHSYAYQSDLLGVDLVNNEWKEYTEAQISILFEEKKTTYKGMKEILKESLKKTVIMWIIFILAIVGILIYYYVTK